MTDVSGVRGPWAVLAGGVAVLVTATVSLLATAPDPASADTVLRGPRSVVLVAANGTTSVPVDGAQVPRGTVVRTGEGGSAELVTAGRRVLVGALTSVAVLDGVRQRLDRGLLLADVRHGPRLALDSQAGTVQVRPAAVVRVERGPLLRVGVFAGRVSLTAADRALVTPVPPLHQVQATYAGLPGRATALALADDVWEERVALPLVTADRELRALAGGLSGPMGRTVLTAAPVELRTGLAVNGTPASTGEQALRLALAQVGHRPGSVLEHLRTVTQDRTDGGSWGVVAALAAASVGEVSALLDGTLPQVAPVVAAGAPGPDPLALLGRGSAGKPSGGAGRSGGSPGGSAPAGPGPSPRPSADPVPVPLPVPVPVPTGVPLPLPSPVPTLPAPPGLVQSVVDGILSLPPSPAAARLPGAVPPPVPVPHPAAPAPAATAGVGPVLPASPSSLVGLGVRLP